MREYILGYTGISGKSAACLLLYKMGRCDFAVDANVLRIMTRLGWLKRLRIAACAAHFGALRRSSARFSPPSDASLAKHTCGHRSIRKPGTLAMLRIAVLCVNIDMV